MAQLGARIKEGVSFGLDIGSAVIKAAKLRISADTVELCGFGVEESPSDASTVVKKISQSLDAKTANISVCGPNTIIRYELFPRMTADELKQALKFEAQNHIPFSINEVNLDASILRQDMPDNKMLVVLAAVKKDFSQQRLKPITDSGLRPQIIDMDSLAIINAFNFNYAQEDGVKDKTVALLNMGALFSNLNILENCTPRLSRDIQIAGNDFTRKISEALGIDLPAAQALKLSPDQERLEKIKSAFDSVVCGLAQEIRTSFDYYESQSASSVQKIFLSGGSARFSPLKDMLANLLGIEVNFWDPLRKIKIPAELDQQSLKAYSLQLPVAIGLALRLRK